MLPRRWPVLCQEIYAHGLLLAALFALPVARSPNALTQGCGLAMSSPVEKPRRLSIEDGYRRFAHEFTLLQTLGRGTFGSVVKVRHHLDNRAYALKVIPCTSSTVHPSSWRKEKTLREVSVLSGLSHRNVVRYYAAWIEETDPSFFGHDDDDDDDDDEDATESGTLTSMTSMDSRATTSRSGTEHLCLFIQVDRKAP